MNNYNESFEMCIRDRFLTFAAFSTLVAVFENIISFDMDLLKWSRRKSVIVSMIAIIILSMPCVLGFNVLAEDVYKRQLLE